MSILRLPDASVTKDLFVVRSLKEGDFGNWLAHTC